MKQKRVLDLLNTTRANFTVAELHNELGFSCSDPELWDMLIHNAEDPAGRAREAHEDGVDHLAQAQARFRGPDARCSSCARRCTTAS